MQLVCRHTLSLGRKARFMTMRCNSAHVLHRKEMTHLLHTIGFLPVVNERHNDPDAILTHLIQNVVDCLEHLLIVLSCTWQSAHTTYQAGFPG